jgi:hypothetical protein
MTHVRERFFALAGKHHARVQCHVRSYGLAASIVTESISR